MNAMVVYDSAFGNTEKVAQAIGRALGSPDEVAVVRVGDARPEQLAGLLFLGTIISGGLLSADKPMPAAISTVHQITPFLTLLSTAATLYLLQSR